MKSKLYGLKDDGGTSITLFPHSSRGPLSNGNRGITFTAPGAANVFHPKWSSNGIRDGTSIAAPIVGGSIACLLSALKANSIKYSPSMIKLALSSTAYLPEGADKLGFGDGIIQINDAFEFIKKNHRIFSSYTITNISLTGVKIHNGILIIKKEKNQGTKNYCINVQNTKKNITWILKSPLKDQQKIIEYPETVKDNKFIVKVDSSLVTPGNLYYTEIHGSNNFFKPEIGPQFTLPITVIVPEKLDEKGIQKEINLENLFKLFFVSSMKSKRCIFKLTAKKTIKTCVFFKYGFENCTVNAGPKMLQFSSHQNVQKRCIPFRANRVTEICIFKDFVVEEKENSLNSFYFELCLEKCDK